MSKTEIGIMDEIMQAVAQCDAWIDAQKLDPAIKEAEDRFHALMERARPLIPEDLWYDLDEVAVGALPIAYGDAGILFGIRLANAMNAVATHPEALSRYVMERTGRLSA